MLKKIFLSSFIFFNLFGIIYPIKKEDTKLFDYCYSLEKSLSRNSLMRRNGSKGVNSITRDILDFGLSKTKGGFLNNAIDKYKKSKNLFLVKLIPNQFYCLIGYWIEEVKPGMFESIILDKGKQKINELKDIEEEIDVFLKDVKSEYNNFKKDFKTIFK